MSSTKIECTACEFYYYGDNIRRLQLHFKRCHVKENIKKCHICSKVFFSGQQLRNHQETHNKIKIYKCDKCNYCTHTNDNLRKHKKIHGPRKSFKCIYCEKVLSDRQSYTNHVLRHTGEAKVYKCENCEFSTPFSHGLRRHVAWKHTFTIEKVKCEKCDKTISRKNYKAHLKRHEGVVKNHKCEKCGMLFEYPSQLKIHEATQARHTSVKLDYPKRTWPCNYCNKSYSDKPNLRRHIARLHTLTMPKVKCQICQQIFTKENYNSHLKRHYGVVKKHACQKCKACFEHPRDLKRHALSHSPTKRLACKQCNKSYAGKESLRAHLKFVHGQKRYNCNICQKLFTTRGYLRIHLKCIHEERQKFRCQKCAGFYSNVETLRNHLPCHINTTCIIE